MKKGFLWVATLVAGSAMLSCNSSDTTQEEEMKVLVNMVAERKPINLTAEQKTFANDNNRFTLNFLKQVNEADHSGKSFIYSPLSITYVLGMVNDAAEGTTRQELEQTLGFHEGGIQAVNEYCRQLIDNLPKADEKVQLNIANAIFLNNWFTLKKQFQQDMQQYYDAKAEALDFSAASTLDHINGWCKTKTEGMIPSILEQVNPQAVSYLLNAIYFKADWTDKFDEKRTKTEDFFTEHGTVKLPMMQQDALVSYVKNDTYAAVEIPYGNGLWTMTVMLPEEGKSIDDVATWLTETGWTVNYWEKNPMSGAEPCEVDLKLPRFETSSDTNDLIDELPGVLKTMGIRQVFDPYFSEVPNMCEDTNVYISMMRQKAAIKVNEKGSEAAAVTIAGMEATSAGIMGSATFHANRPFVYVVRETSSGVILFVGKFTGE